MFQVVALATGWHVLVFLGSIDFILYISTKVLAVYHFGFSNHVGRLHDFMASNNP